MPLLQLLETILVLYVLFVGCIALSIYIGSVCVRFVRESKKRQSK